MLWVLGIVALIAVIGGIYLSQTLTRNGPAVLTVVDRITGGSGGTDAWPQQ